ncbi:nuclear protein Es2 [Gregarina niphandrodes]|uniref:Nuclear protein Es2 n=1 Tax=Gregarina niphandrodes TaxID=110365 RepID=A0A023B3E1_GRENI|nr:nuclear protein Es2 [Gregarina niphandrodes]EZG55516.1 nuclear protein Es2 [Gregarina niphandrodes]|eukprot:XP_011131502.1 nuclear protein Es2 [Gregarina niphandrodes]
MKIVLCGEGDFSFGRWLAASIKHHHKSMKAVANGVPYRKRAFDDELFSLDYILLLLNVEELPKELHMIATSLDSREEVLKKYPDALSHLDYLETPCRYPSREVRHGVDACTMACDADRVIWNHPHAGIESADVHHDLIRRFLKNVFRPQVVDEVERDGGPPQAMPLETKSLETKSLEPSPVETRLVVPMLVEVVVTLIEGQFEQWNLIDLLCHGNDQPECTPMISLLNISPFFLLIKDSRRLLKTAHFYSPFKTTEEEEDGGEYDKDRYGRIVLSEDDYNRRLEAIIAKQYFPIVHEQKELATTLAATTLNNDEGDHDEGHSQETNNARQTINEFQLSHTTEDNAAADKMMQLDKLKISRTKAKMLTDSDTYNKHQQRLRDGRGDGLIFHRHASQNALMFGVKNDEKELRALMNQSEVPELTLGDPLQAAISSSHTCAIQDAPSKNDGNSVAVLETGGTVIIRPVNTSWGLNEESSTRADISRQIAEVTRKKALQQEQLTSGIFTKDLDSRIVERTPATYLLQEPSKEERTAEKLRDSHVKTKKDKIRVKESRFGQSTAGGNRSGYHTASNSTLLNSQLGKILSRKLRGE